MDQNSLLIYSPDLTGRIIYIVTHLVGNVIGLRPEFTSDREYALGSGRPFINYSRTDCNGAVNIVPAGLLEREGVEDLRPAPAIVDGRPVLFPDGGGNTGFDVFAACFYMISRYEEYLPFKGDAHGRFPREAALVHRYSIGEEPWVEIWVQMLKDSIQRNYPSVSFPEREFRFIPTIDIDVPWAYLSRSLWRTAGGTVRSLLNADLAGVAERFMVLAGFKKDPYDTYSLIQNLHNECNLSPVYFFNAGTRGRYDKGISLKNSRYRALVSYLALQSDWGIHPSYRSHDDEVLLERELSLMESVTGMAPLRSRNHYLRYSFPSTPALLEKNGVMEDYTLGWAELPGFRAGTCTPFHFYNLREERATTLKIYPFHLMDGTLLDYMGLSPDEALEEAVSMIEKVRRVNGTLITLWHNDSFSESGRWKEWGGVYPEVLKAASQ